MPILATLNFTPIPNSAKIWFINAAAWNAYLASITVNLSGINLPIATLTDFGSVKKAAAGTAYNHTPGTGSYITIYTDQNNDGADEAYQIGDKVFIDAILAKLDALSANYAALKTALTAANIL